MATEIAPSVFDITCKVTDGSRYRVFFDISGTPTLFDTGFADTTHRVIEEIADIGVEPDRCILTHADHDHVGGFDTLASHYDLQTFVPEQSHVDFVETPDVRYNNGDMIGKFTAVHVPGHEPDSYVLINESTGIAVCGDVLSGSDQRGLPAGYFVLPPAVYSADLNQAEENLERLLSFQFDTALLFHGSSVLSDASEKLERFVNFPGKPT